jgi:hypothetical protein
MLFAKRNRPAGVQKKKAEWIYRQATTKEYNNRGQKDRHSVRLELAVGSLEAVFESSDVERFVWILMEV